MGIYLKPEFQEEMDQWWESDEAKKSHVPSYLRAPFYMTKKEKDAFLKKLPKDWKLVAVIDFITHIACPDVTEDKEYQYFFNDIVMKGMTTKMVKVVPVTPVVYEKYLENPFKK